MSFLFALALVVVVSTSGEAQARPAAPRVQQWEYMTITVTGSRYAYVMVDGVQRIGGEKVDSVYRWMGGTGDPRMISPEHALITQAAKDGWELVSCAERSDPRERVIQLLAICHLKRPKR